MGNNFPGPGSSDLLSLALSNSLSIVEEAWQWNVLLVLDLRHVIIRVFVSAPASVKSGQCCLFYRVGHNYCETKIVDVKLKG